MTYAEALAEGLPLLCRRDGCLEGVVKAGENGWQYENLDQFIAFLKEWKSQSEDGKRRMRRCAQKSADRFSAEAFGREVERIYEQERTRKKSLEYHFADRAAPVRRTGGMGM